MNNSDLLQRSLASVWHPCTQMKQHAGGGELPMIPIARGRRGSAFFRDASKSPSFVSFSFSDSYACIRSPIPCRRIAVT